MNMIAQLMQMAELVNAQVVVTVEQPSGNLSPQRILAGTVGIVSSYAGSGFRMPTDDMVRVNFPTPQGSVSFSAHIKPEHLLLTQRMRGPVNASALEKLQKIPLTKAAITVLQESNRIMINQQVIKALGYNNAHRVQFLSTSYAGIMFLAITDSAKPSTAPDVIPGFLPKMTLTHPANAGYMAENRRYIIEDEETVTAIFNACGGAVSTLRIDILPGLYSRQLTYCGESVTAYLLLPSLSLGDRAFSQVLRSARSSIDHCLETNLSNLVGDEDGIVSDAQCGTVNELAQQLFNLIIEHSN